MRFFHVSKNKDLDKEILQPRIPINRMNNEKHSVPCICASPSINGCLTATGGYEKGDIVYVYECYSESYIQPTEEEVLDAPLTGEFWLLKPTKMNHFAKIKIKEEIKCKLNELGMNFYPFEVLG